MASSPPPSFRIIKLLSTGSPLNRSPKVGGILGLRADSRCFAVGAHPHADDPAGGEGEPHDDAHIPGIPFSKGFKGRHAFAVDLTWKYGELPALVIDLEPPGL